MKKLLKTKEGIIPLTNGDIAVGNVTPNEMGNQNAIKG